MFHMFVCVCVFWSYVIVNHFNFSIIFINVKKNFRRSVTLL